MTENAPRDEDLAADRTKMKVSDTDVAIEIKNMNKWYGDFHVLRDINLSVNAGERIVICGPSGSGKSTLIRCINRLEEHQEGEIIVDGIELTDDLKNIDEIRARSRHGVPALQPVSASDDARKLHAGADLGAQDAQEGGRSAGRCTILSGSRSASRR
jgi:energy-coupling factor transporter ATP-binding protein EcfA2